MTEITFVIWVFVFFGMCITMSWVIVVAYRFTELLESHLNRSKYVANNRLALSFAGMPGKVLRSGAMAMLFFFPELSERRGLIEKNELSNVPAHLKRKLLAPFIALWISFFSLVIFRFLVLP